MSEAIASDATAGEAERTIRAAADAIVAAATPFEPGLAGARILAIGWATVDLDRAERELGEALGSPLHARPRPRDIRFGATAREAHPFGREPALVLLEPDTEGRLAAILARHGEGVAAVYLESSAGIRVLEVTSGRGGPARAADAGRPPSVAG